MNFGFSAEQEELRAVVRRFLEEKSPESEVRRLMATAEGYDPAVWSQMANELALQGLAIPEEFGGQGFGPVELYVVFEEMGAALYCGPYFSTVALAANALVNAGDVSAQRTFLPGIADGTTIATVALTDEAGSWDLAATSTTAVRDGDGWSLSGVRSFVTDGALADLILVPARTATGLSLFAVAGDAAGLTRESLATMDQTRKQSRLTLDGVSATLVGEEGGATPGLEATVQMAAAMLAAEQVGGAQRVLDRAVEYAKSRVQFGRPIGSFQAIKHKLADVYVAVELARSNAFHACWALEAGAATLPLAAATARVSADAAFFHAAKENLQTHGGIGFTWEADCHLFYRRAQQLSAALGGPRYWKEQVAAALDSANET